MTKPSVSIITPTYNRAYILGTAIGSVLAQTDPRWELIVVDDGSTDNTAELVKSYADPRIRYFKQPNAGPCVARNLGVSHAIAPWIAYLDSDNTLLPMYVDTMLRHFKSHPAALYGLPKGDYAYDLVQNGHVVATLDKSGEFPDHLTLTDVFHRTFPVDMNGFMHARRLFAHGIAFDPGVPGFEDWELMLQMGTKFPNAFTYVPSTLYRYRQRYGADSRSGSASYSRRARIYEYIWRKHRYAPLMAGQDWYPAEANRWRHLEAEFQTGRLPSLNLYEFPAFWPQSLQPTTR
jgi:glycosyltransferase involved in cell wall biosynthesis